MRQVFSEETLCHRAAERLAGDGLLPFPGGSFFDPDLPLPGSTPPDGRFPTFERLPIPLSDAYARHVETAFVQMSDFASGFWPLIDNLIYAQPFFEWVMHADPVQPYYRDHIVHQVRVAAIGDILLDADVGGQTLLARATGRIELDDTIEDKYRQEFVRLAWWFAALFHDCGYPYQYHTGACHWLRSIYRAPIPDPAAAPWRRYLGYLAELVGNLSPADFSNLGIGEHAFYGAVEIAAQSQAYEEGMGGVEEIEYRNRRRALLSQTVRAILRHHHGGKSVRFENNPLGFLLVLADELHECGRPQGTPTVEEYRTITEYPTNAVKASSLDFLEEGRPGKYRLELCFDISPDETIAGRRAERWREKKEQDLHKFLALGGRGNLFSKLNVSIGPILYSM